MLTGKKLFEAGDVSEMLASVLIKDPDVSSIGQHVPDHMRSVVALSSLTLAGGYEPIHFSYRTGLRDPRRDGKVGVRTQVHLCAEPYKEINMTWTKPEIKEIALAMEVTLYVRTR